MQMTFLNAAGTVLFVRDDMEQGNWTHEEYTVNATFPYIAGKVIERGMRLCFRNHATNNLEFFEIRNVTTIEPEHYQQIIAESLVVSELSDEHCNTQEITDKTAAQALGTVLTGTLWSVGNSTVSATNSVDIARGSVWQAVNSIAQNWNAYITSRITVNTSGGITGRYLDIAPAQGTWRGVRLSIDKNMSDSSVVYDDSEVLTALYGYGGNIDVPQTTGDDQTEELTFADVVWTATADHPAKPDGQTYLEDPAKTALYGRNGRARFGYYQNGNITDAETLLEKTWEALKNTSQPKVSISGTVSDLYRLGYADQPLQLHDIALVEIRETGEVLSKEIIKLDEDLLDPTATRPEIGDYIPNIVYIDRETNVKATGGGGGGGRGQTNQEDDDSKTYSGFEKTNDMIAMVVGTRDGDNYIKAGEIGLAINETGEPGSYETTAYINADHINISATQTAYSLAGEMERDANGKLIIKNAGGMYVQRTEQGVTAQFGVWDDGNITSGMVVSKINGQTSTQILANYVDIAGVVTAINNESGTRLDINADQVTISGSTTLNNFFSSGGGAMQFNVSRLSADYITIGGSGGPSDAYGATFSWQSYAARYCNLSDQKYFLYSDVYGGTSAAGTVTGRVVTGYSDLTIYYLGRANSPS